MTRQENILTLNEHLDHWKRLLSEKICNQSEGEKTIDALQNAIKALEQEPCEDCISRHAALEAFGLSEKSRKYGGDHSGYDTLMKYEIQDILEDLPSVTPQPKMGYCDWIPVSDRLPEVGQRVIATIKSIDGNYVRETICGKYGLLCGNGIAWMPLPEPYLPDINVGNMSEMPTEAEGSDKE